MSECQSLNEVMLLFRIASRDLYNNCFRYADAVRRPTHEQFEIVQQVLWQMLVSDPFDSAKIRYGFANPAIIVTQKFYKASAQINREICSGHWDHSVKEITREAHLSFVEFFDFGQSDYVDHQYVRVQIDDWPSKPELVGKHALLEFRDVTFVTANANGKSMKSNL